MIIDCHGHYTTAPQALWDWRKKQVTGQEPGKLKISDQEMQKMNYAVDAQHRDTQDVVREFLRSKKLVP